VLAKAFSNVHSDGAATVESSTNFGSTDCQALRFGETRLRWSLKKNGMQVDVIFGHDKEKRTDQIDLVYTLVQSN
jgi:hypothetical protein